ncbi:MAG TPA: tetraacyldisaccharide 4'-kinase [Thermoanaerobaculia bacterium]|nr:tetraacyldisaccharide 4'-kinase [Thermoanaerobaculia bacterium]
MTAPPPSRSPWQRLYAAAHRRRVGYWSTRAERLPVPVWSIGNLHWGGTGKTPVVGAVASWLCERGVAVAVLSRGYGRRGSGPLVVSTGAGPLVLPERAGDEPWLLAESLPGVPVAVAARRIDAARLLLATLAAPPQLFLLDDGFSHLRLHRDLDLLALPDDDPFGGGRLLPSGRLREPLVATARAHAVLLTGAGATPERAREVSEALAAYGFAGAAFACVVRPQAPQLVKPADSSERVTTRAGGSSNHQKNSQTVASINGPPGALLLVTGIARPERVRRAAAAAGVTVADHVAFADHHAYPPRSVRLIARAAQRAEAVGVLTTAKDRVKLDGKLALPLWELPVTAAPEPAFWSWLSARLPATHT